MGYTLSDLNQMEEDDFSSTLGNIFEETPAIARQTWAKRPFESVEGLHRALVETMRALDNSAQLALIRAHPELGTKFAMTEDSRKEQEKAGLNDITYHESNRLQMLSRTYTNKFGFPFILAIKRQTISSILDIFEQRLNHSIEQEIAQALTEIEKIAWFRLMDSVR
ncbi:2-oxo-4-hydroxy-4-carboxy-5-ureidoimidazoline decarboxylase [Okeania sp. SIO2G5]|uniref:2-oxo-4-hydroxy-4-carboxy-5-ureidoimidazoline decarboxylase n=1 Tax=Okeania sp. SIO2G5 TaxID=2607796 RepID=UPI0013C194DD|nr:2-oxo-4-hydroxy-4-carboxy-5-ureidoimidazoline decarboxylase [Okeania sp. SIO2G5]NEP76630.1 2-oxo-4-hydroxy-4-carboxy-5-ureidoimidazoline decarboxylase [Okeania sp. SIO2G5]